jgi:molybdate transport system permease protein
MSWAPLLLSFEVAAAATLVAGALGIGLGWALARGRFVGRELVDVLVTAPMVLPPTVLGYYVLVALGRSSPLGQVFEDITGSSIVFTKTGAIVAATIGALPLITKAARAAIEGVDPDVVAAAQTLGAGPLRIFLKILLPLSAGGVLAGLSLGFARALGDFGVTLMVAGNIPGLTQTGALAIYDAVAANHDAEAAGMAAVMTAAAMTVLYVANRLGRRRREDG